MGKGRHGESVRWRRGQRTEAKRKLSSMSALFVDLAPVADVVRIDAALRQIEFIKNTIITYSQLKLGPPAKSLVREFVPTALSFHPIFVEPPHGPEQAANQMIWRTLATKSGAQPPQIISAGESCIAQPRSRAGIDPAWL